ncbi:MAG: hypothetical protein ACEQSA_03825 [Weeksellaceae bacterium]
MKKNLPVILGIIIILIAVISGAVLMQRSNNQMVGEDKPIQPAEGGTANMKSLQELMAMGKNQKCTFEYNDPNGGIEGTTYISASNVRSDFNNTDKDGKTSNGGMITDGDFMYTWTSDSKEGVKTAITDDMQKTVEEEREKFMQNPDTYMDPNQKVEYDCANWNPDVKVFTPPADIKFTDYSVQMQQMQEELKKMGGEQCQVCTNLTGESAEACKKSLGCE